MDKSDFSILLCILNLTFIICFAIIFFNDTNEIQNRIDILVESQDEINTTNADRLYELGVEIEELKIDNKVLSNKVSELQSKVEELELYCERNSKLSDVLCLTETDIEIFEYILMAEGGYEPFEGKLAICSVIINRVFSNEFPDTLVDVITQKGQFEPVTKNTLFSKQPTEDVKYAVKTILNMSYNEMNEEFGNFMFFKVTSSDKSWQSNIHYVTTIGKTDFYAFNE